MSDKPERIDIPTGGTLIGAFRAFRDMIEASEKAKGRELDPEWYKDGPEDMPELYSDRGEEEPDGPDDEN